MSRPTPDRAGRGRLSPARLAAQWLARFRLAPLLLRSEGVWDGLQAWPGFDAWCEAHGGQSCALSVSSALLHELVCDVDLPLADDPAALAWARPLLQHFHGDAAQGWPLAAWQDGPTRGISALHGVRLDGVLSSARQHGVRVLAVRPWWARVLQLSLKRQPALRQGPARLLVLEGQGLTELVLREGQVMGVQIRRLDEATSPALRAWCEEHPGDGPTFTVGYGLAPSPTGAPGLPAALDALDAPAPSLRWLSASPA